MKKPFEPTLQNVILKLQQFWADQGCLIWQPYHTEVGAGTMNPATFLRVVGPEDWWVAYVEPSIRPTDSRYGENPNRWGHYYQFQVILKPDPGDPQERYLDSLVALGIDPAKHDIRFVEDNWEQPALGAWGLGWEVWLDGQEITQFTYFQQAGGKLLDPVSVEITYGLERIVLALQNVESFVDIRWNERVSYGEVLLDAEREHSRYTFEAADVERLRVMFDVYEAEANSALDRGLIYPAHDYVLKCSHTFNLLDGRGAVGVTERAAIFGRMRELARRVTDGYLEQRQAVEFPWVGRWTPVTPHAKETSSGKPPVKAEDFILEIGTEELPPSEFARAQEQLLQGIQKQLDQSRLKYGALRVLGTPRRLVVAIDGLVAQQDEQVSLEKGPPVERAFDAEGNPTKAAEGFARGKGIELDQLQKQELDGGYYVVAEVKQAGRPTYEVLEQVLPELIGGLRFEKSMRWNASGIAFSRPVRWILALHGEYCLNIEFAGVQSARTTRLLRFSQPDAVEVNSAKEYSMTLAKEGIVLDHSQRSAVILDEITRLAAEVGGEVAPDMALLDEVASLVEQPTVLRGSFDASYLELPQAVLVSVMKKHQRYFPVEKAGVLLPNFIAVRNGGSKHLDTVVSGNEQVIRARFADAAYFIKRDSEASLEDFRPSLSTLMFEKTLGSMLDKAERVEALLEKLARVLDLTGEQLQHAIRAAHLCKADLATQMVVEMTSLQGEVGRIYALRSGESDGVAQAIYEHYLPRFSGDSLPESRPGLLLGLADRIDTLIGLFAAGHKPSGTRDPFAIRRTSIGLIQLLIGDRQPFDLREALAVAAALQPLKVSTEQIEECLAYIIARQQALLLEEHPHDAVEAILAAQGHDPASAAAAVAALAPWREQADWPALLQAYARCVRITRDHAERIPVSSKALVEKAEIDLHQAFLGLEPQDGSVDTFLNAVKALLPPITAFFEEVLVMADNEDLRQNRLGLLQSIAALADGVADLSLLEGF